MGGDDSSIPRKVQAREEYELVYTLRVKTSAKPDDWYKIDNRLQVELGLLFDGASAAQSRIELSRSDVREGYR